VSARGSSWKVQRPLPVCAQSGMSSPDVALPTSCPDEQSTSAGELTPLITAGAAAPSPTKSSVAGELRADVRKVELACDAP
jgi:hypothetical protein